MHDPKAPAPGRGDLPRAGGEEAPDGQFTCSTGEAMIKANFFLSLSLFFFFFVFPELHPWHMEVPRLGVESELQLPAYTTATATWDLSCQLHL